MKNSNLPANHRAGGVFDKNMKMRRDAGENYRDLPDFSGGDYRIRLSDAGVSSAVFIPPEQLGKRNATKRPLISSIFFDFFDIFFKKNNTGHWWIGIFVVAFLV